jgi:alpha 1,3-glucosidase
MQHRLWSQGRRMVTIIDPHIFRDNNYRIHKEATQKGLYVKDNTGKKDFEGWCWPGSSSYLDFTSEKVRNYWADQFAYDKYEGSTPSLFTWNDMNEPSVFNGPEVSMQKDLLNLNGQEHREWHNLYGMLFHKATGMGLIRRNKGEDVRPFVLSRSFFAGSQRYGAIWTGDNAAEWSHLDISSPMLLSLNTAALSFVGADVGGFFGNPDAELMTRWMQAGAYQPFFRGHAHHDAKRREPWMFGEETMRRLRKAAMERYALLPFWYTVFHEASTTGMPVMRTMWMQYPQVESLFGVDSQYLIGADLLVRPVTSAGTTMSIVRFPTKDNWYDVQSNKVISKAGSETGVKEVTVPSGIDKIPVYQRGGSVIARKLRLRRSTHMMKKDPYTLYIALDVQKKAAGKLYMDDEESFGHKTRSEYAEADFSVDLSSSVGTIKNTVAIGGGWTTVEKEMTDDRMIERVIIMGIDRPPKSIKNAELSIDFEYDAAGKVLILRKPGVSALTNWEILFQ